MNRPNGAFPPARLGDTPAWIRWTWSWWPRIGFALVAAFFVVSLGLDFTFVGAHVPLVGWSHKVSGLVVALLAIAALPQRRRPVRTFSATLLAAAVVFGLSVATALFIGDGVVIAPTGSEVIGTGLLAGLTVRRCGPRRTVVAVTAAAVALGTAAPLRMPESFTLLQEALYLLLLAVAVSIALLVRAQSVIRAQEMDRARRQERLALARDVHDTIAHHMTGIIVQSQASRHVAERDPTVAVRALKQIENASTEALTAMRRVVGALRDEDTPAPREPGELHAALEELTGQESRPPAHLVLNNETQVELPAEVSTTVLRIAREALTNARRHARDATRIDVHVRVRSDQVTLDVRDDGRGAAQLHGAGHGLAGIAERAELLGGEFSAGPIDGHGWHVRTRLPTKRTLR